MTETTITVSRPIAAGPTWVFAAWTEIDRLAFSWIWDDTAEGGDPAAIVEDTVVVTLDAEVAPGSTLVTVDHTSVAHEPAAAGEPSPAALGWRDVLDRLAWLADQAAGQSTSSRS